MNDLKDINVGSQFHCLSHLLVGFIAMDLSTDVNMVTGNMCSQATHLRVDRKQSENWEKEYCAASDLLPATRPLGSF